MDKIGLLRCGVILMLSMQECKCQSHHKQTTKNSGSIPRNVCCLRNILMRAYQESVTTGQTDGCLTKLSLCAYASQATQKYAYQL